MKSCFEMERRALLGAITAVLGIGPRIAWAQQAAKPVRIGVLSISPSPFTMQQDGFRADLRDLGWIDGQNLVIVVRSGEGRAERVPALVAELRVLQAALIVVGGTTAARVVRDAAPGMPIVMAGAGDPVGAGLVASLARPGGDVTGVSLAAQEVVPKALELLNVAVPRLKRMTLLMNRANPANDFFYTHAAARAQALAIQLERSDVRQAGDLDAAVTRAAGGGLVIIGADPMFQAHKAWLARLVLDARVPAILVQPNELGFGALMSYSADYREVVRRTASFVDRILRGAKPADLPVEQPTKYLLAINLKTAKALDIVIPQSLLLHADELIR